MPSIFKENLIDREPEEPWNEFKECDKGLAKDEEQMKEKQMSGMWKLPRREAKAKEDKNPRKEFNQEFQRAFGRNRKQCYQIYKGRAETDLEKQKSSKRSLNSEGGFNLELVC